MGGFLGAVVIIPTQLMGYYASGMLSRSLANKTPVRIRSSKNSKTSWNNLGRKVVLNASQLGGLNTHDIPSLIEQASQITRVKVSKCKSVFFSKLLCKKDLKIKVLEKSWARHEDSLDIRNFVQVRTSLALMLRSLLNLN